jgi:hypothetical protein
MQLITKAAAAQASYRYGGCVNLVSDTVPCSSTYTYGALPKEIGGRTVKLYFAEVDGIVGWWFDEV